MILASFEYNMDVHLINMDVNSINIDVHYIKMDVHSINIRSKYGEWTINMNAYDTYLMCK